MHQSKSVAVLFATALLTGVLLTGTTSAQRVDSIAAFVAASGEGFDSNPFDYDILLAAATAANLVGDLANPEADLTLFAPNDLAFIILARDLGYSGFDEAEAFNVIADATGFTGGDPTLLTNILLYHVAPESLSAIDVLLAGLFGESINTLFSGESFGVRFLTLIDNDADDRNPSVFFPFNVRTGNGIVHTVSRVLRPIDLP